MTGDALTQTQKLTLLACAVSTMLVTIDFTAMGVVITPIEKDLDSDLSTLQWIINGYFLMFAALLVTGGRLADMFGRRKILVAGLVIFAAMSLLGALAATDWWLIGARVLQGAGGALLWPAAMGIAFAVVPPSRKAFAMGIIIGAAGLGTALGPALGGLFGELVSWRLVLYFNIPVAAAALALALRYVADDAGESGEHRIDYAGVVTFGGGLAALLVAIDQSSAWGWGDERTIGLLVLSALLFGALALVERRGSQPLLPSDVIRNRRFLLPALVGSTLAAPFFITVLYTPQFLEKFKGWTTLAAGAGTLPLTVAFAAVAFFASRFYARLGARVLVTGSAFLISLGALVLALVDETTSYAVMIPGLAVMGVGLGIGLSAANTAAVGAVEPRRTAVAGGIAYMLRTMVATIIVAVATAVYISAGDSRLTDTLNAEGVSLSSTKISKLEGSLAGTESAQQVLGQLPAKQADRVEPAVADAFLASFHDVMFIAAALAALGGLASLIFLGGRVHRPHRPELSTLLSGGPHPPAIEHHKEPQET